MDYCSLHENDRLGVLEDLPHRAIGFDTIAAEAGISKRTLYDYFPSKDHLIVAYLSRRMRPNPASDAPPLEQTLSNIRAVGAQPRWTRLSGLPLRQRGCRTW
jgi:AcrR family transcriptional regulator